MDIPEFYRNRDVLITGVTGFIGKVLLEKLLRSCDVGKVYVLVRTKKGIKPEERINEMFQAEIFKTLKCDKPNILNKVRCIEGNILHEHLGISHSDINLLIENVSVVFHIAASVKFEDSFRNSFCSNVQATKNLADVCRLMKKLLALVHVSTAYCNCERQELDEKIYPVSQNYEDYINILKLNDNFIEEIVPKLLDGRPNTYLITKAITENLLNINYRDLPVIIIRPSIVSSSWKEPMPGWNDSFNGANGLVAAAMKGILRSMLIHGEKVCDLIPVDIVVNLMISIGWEKAKKLHDSSQEILVYNCTSGSLNPMTWIKSLNIMYKYVWNYPSQKVFIYPAGGFRRNYYWNRLCVLLEHNFPAVLVDILLVAMGRRPKLINIYNKLHKAISVLEYFSTREWKFHSTNMMKLKEKMSSDDKEAAA
ncbi:putative fatty acyl-CoA reductase CG5065 [Centruroides vittatus]|uniref:putative fatty acyl-CoA reductase CG5065 n=1 Tax=Centruroides vittatus TaxID=120091 RepID=UPI00350F7DFD